MKPTAYIPFYYNDFFQAMAGYSGDVQMSYLRAICHYWHHGCDGMPDDDDYLRRICHCQPSIWPEVKAVVFDNRFYFKLAGGLWHQKRANHEYTKTMEIYAARSESGRRAMQSRWHNKRITNG